MTVVECEQGDAVWHETRLGIPTASKASMLLTPTCRPSKSARLYRAKLLAEYVTGDPMDGDLSENEWIQRGIALEPEARNHYAIVHSVEVQRVGLCVCSAREVCGPDPDGVVTSLFGPDEYVVAASPDGLVGDDGLIELKVPAPHTHILWLADGGLPREHVMQVQMQLWATGRKWADFMSYHPQLPPVLVRVEPDEAIQAALDDILPAFVAELAEGRKRLSELGVESWADKQAEHERLMAEHDAEEAAR